MSSLPSAPHTVGGALKKALEAQSKQLKERPSGNQVRRCEMNNRASSSTIQERCFTNTPRLTSLSSGAWSHLRGVKRTTLKAKTPRDPSRYKTGKRHSVWIPPSQDEDKTQHLRGQHAQAHTPGTHAHAHPRLLELTHGPKRVPAPSQPNGCGGRVHLPAPAPQGNPHPPFSADKEGPRRPPRGEVPSPGGLGLPGSHATL